MDGRLKGMPRHVRLVHKILDGRFHVYTSPDVKGLHASSETQAEAQRVALKVLDFIVERRGWTLPTVAFEETIELALAS